MYYYWTHGAEPSRVHQFMKRKWPTLEGRLKHAPTSELDALLQLQRDNELTEYAKKRLAKLISKERVRIPAGVKP